MQATLDHPGATAPLPLRTSQQVTRAALVVVGAISVLGGCLQMVLGQPDTTPRLDNVHRFLAGVYLGSGFISLWAARDHPAPGRAGLPDRAGRADGRPRCGWAT